MFLRFPGGRVRYTPPRTRNSPGTRVPIHVRCPGSNTGRRIGPTRTRTGCDRSRSPPAGTRVVDEPGTPLMLLRAHLDEERYSEIYFNLTSKKKRIFCVLSGNGVLIANQKKVRNKRRASHNAHPTNGDARRRERRFA